MRDCRNCLSEDHERCTGCVCTTCNKPPDPPPRPLLCVRTLKRLYDSMEDDFPPTVIEAVVQSFVRTQPTVNWEKVQKELEAANYHMLNNMVTRSLQK